MLERLKTEGSGLPSVVLAEGAVLLEKFKAELEAKRARREDLLESERLFDLERTSYPTLLEAEAEMEQLCAIYAVYSAHEEAIHKHDAALWSDLDLKKLHAVAKRFDEKLEAMREDASLCKKPVFELLEENLAAFADALLFEALKSVDALRPEALATAHAHHRAARRRFRLATLTLGSLLAMETHKHHDPVLEMCIAAEKELKIEGDIAKFALVWREQKFTLARYVKSGDVDRGFILRSTEETTIILEDMNLTLQSMMASRFVKPFTAEVEEWEGKLSLIGEVLEVWMAVQRKWMYLESIFIGSDDIRDQLPEEARALRQDRQELGGDHERNRQERQHPGVLLGEEPAANLQEIAENLERCQKSLSEYLDNKRNAFRVSSSSPTTSCTCSARPTRRPCRSTC